MDILYDWIRNIIFYMILNTIVMNLLGNSSYKKYASIASGMILVLLVVSPLFQLLKIEKRLDFSFKSNEFALEASEFQNNILRMEEEQKNQIFQEYSLRIQTQVESILNEEGVIVDQFEVSFDQDPESQGFGEIVAMNIKGSVSSKEPQKKSSISIEKIEIQSINMREEKEKEVTSLSPLELNMKIKVSDFYKIPSDNINISIQGG